MCEATSLQFTFLKMTSNYVISDGFEKQQQNTNVNFLTFQYLSLFLQFYYIDIN